MHEVGLCEGILHAVERRAKGRRVTEVTVRIGTLHAVVEPALAQSFELVSAGTVAGGAAIRLVTVDGDEFTLESIRLAEEAEPERHERSGEADRGARGGEQAHVPRNPR